MIHVAKNEEDVKKIVNKELRKLNKAGLSAEEIEEEVYNSKARPEEKKLIQAALELAGVCELVRRNSPSDPEEPVMDMDGFLITPGAEVWRHPIIGKRSKKPKKGTVKAVAPMHKGGEMMVWFKEGGGAHHPEACEVVGDESRPKPLPVSGKGQ